MLAFAVYLNGQLAEKVDLSGSYLVGSDDVPLRAELTFEKGVITCRQRMPGPAGLAIPWNVEGVGRLLLETTRLLERKQPYIVQVELARGRLMRINQKAEDWGIIGYEGSEEIAATVTRSRSLLIAALKADTPAEAAAKGDEALAQAVQASEAMSRLHAQVLVDRRKQSGGFPRRVFGCAIHLAPPTQMHRKHLTGAFDFVVLPIVWRDIEPSEQTFNWKPLDAWVEWLAKRRIPMKGSALLSLTARSVPDWVYTWEHDFDTVRDLASEHMRRVINRYGQYIHVWDVISGVHAGGCFTFNFEQLMELTRMAGALVKKTAPRAVAIVDLIAPWGEYYARNQQTIPPPLYADMTVQSGVNFDAFGLQFQFGPGVDGMYVRDMFQISSLLDTYAKLGKPLHITAASVPSDAVGPVADRCAIPAGGKPRTTARAESARAETLGSPGANDGGIWHEPWNERVQSEWLAAFVDIALSKPFVETVSWHTLADHKKQTVPHGGLLRSDLQPKAAYQRLLETRSSLLDLRPPQPSSSGRVGS